MNVDCTHKQDAIVSCSMLDFDKTIAPEEGTIRLKEYDEVKRSGRLEYFAEGKWGTVCNKDFGNFEAKVAC